MSGMDFRDKLGAVTLGGLSLSTAPVLGGNSGLLYSGFILHTQRKRRTSSSGGIATHALVKGCCQPTYEVHSEQDGYDLLPESGWRYFGSFCLLQGRNPSDEIHFLGPPDLGFLRNLPEGVETKKDRNIDVSGQESTSGEIPENLKTINEDDDCAPC